MVTGPIAARNVLRCNVKEGREAAHRASSTAVHTELLTKFWAYQCLLDDFDARLDRMMTVVLATEC
eukprot:scaffold73686_cov52-Prasinocladus_malaysianus.AAC.1